MSDFVPDIVIMKKKDYVASTTVIKGVLNNKLDTNILSKFLIITHKFSKEGKRIKLLSGTRKNIPYYGPDGAIIFLGYKDIRRGMRTGAMSNMISLDIQMGGKNIHIKMSSNSITTMGTTTVETGIKVINRVMEHLFVLHELLKFSNSLSKEEKEKNINWLLKELSEFKSDTIEKDILQELEIDNEMNKKFILFLLKYYDDHDDLESYENHINLLVNDLILTEDGLKCENYNIFNSVYHIMPIKNPNFKMPLHKLAPFLAEEGVAVTWHSAFSEGCNVCFDIEEEKEDKKHKEKNYKHRFTIHATSEIRQSSPTKKDEAYKYYLGLMTLLTKFFNKKDIDFKKYISESLKEKQTLKTLSKLKK